MSNTVSFNLLKFVERRPVLSAGRIVSAIILCAIIMLAYFFFQVAHIRYVTDESSHAGPTVNQLTETVRPLLQKGAGNPVVGVLSSAVPEAGQGFYPEFEALTHIQVQGLWLEKVTIQRFPTFIKITGAMDAPDKIDQLLKQLALHPAFKNIHFIGVDVSQGLLPNVPKQYEEEIKQLKLPVFYDFTLQTTPLKSSALKAREESV